MMRTLLVFLLAVAFPAIAGANIWDDSENLVLDATNPTSVAISYQRDEDTGKKASKILLEKGRTFTLHVKKNGKTYPEEAIPGDPIRVKITKSDRETVQENPLGTNLERTIEKTGEFTFTPSEDGYLFVSRGVGTSSVLEIRHAKPVETFSTLNAGLIFTQQNRDTFDLIDAYDSTGNLIADRKIVLKNQDDTSITNELTGKYYYVFGENQKTWLVSNLQKILSLGLFTEGENRFGMFLGVAGSGNDANVSYQTGFSYFPDPDMNLAFSLGLNFAKGDRLISRFKPGDLVSLTSLDDVTRKRWTSGWFFSINFTGADSGK